ncbi:MAG: hypothetical protein NTW17_00585 [Candidatus Pacearchaeota archaeon]|nr:hypothetical protein [Candidatus Pacearchaeota archaeon]
MAKVIFKFNKEKDLWNIWDTCNSKSELSEEFKKQIPEAVLNLCKGKKFEEVNDKLGRYQQRIHSNILIPSIVRSFNESWKEINDLFFERLEKLMKKSFQGEKVTGYLTIISRCPYNYNVRDPSFYVPLFGGIPIAMRTTGHEIMHIHFHNTYWKEIKEKIGEKKTSDLKEALTVLLNLEFKDLWIIPDNGYPQHQELRKFIEKTWKEVNDFDLLLKRCIEYLK